MCGEGLYVRTNGTVSPACTVNSATIFRFSPRIETGVRNSSRSGHQAETVILQARGPGNNQSVVETHDELTPQGNTASHADDQTNHPEVPVAYQGDKPESVRVAMRRAMDRTWKHLAKGRLDDMRPDIPLGDRFWPLSCKEKAAVDELFATDAARRSSAVPLCGGSGHSGCTRILRSLRCVDHCDFVGFPIRVRVSARPGTDETSSAQG